MPTKWSDAQPLLKYENSCSMNRIKNNFIDLFFICHRSLPQLFESKTDWLSGGVTLFSV